MIHDPTAPSAGREPESSDAEPDISDAEVDSVGPDHIDTELDGLMARLRTISDQLDPPPPLVTDLARAAFETRDLDAELAVLTADSDVDTLALTRAAETSTAPRMVSFESGNLGVELQFESVGGEVAVRGLITGAADVVVELDTGNARFTTSGDAGGWFSFLRVVAATVRFRITGGGSTVVTPWIFL